MFCPNCGNNIGDQPAGFCIHCGSPVKPAPPPPPAAPLPGAMPAPLPVTPTVFDYATWGTRVLGYLIDGALVGAAGGVLLLVAIFGFGGIAGIGHGLGSEGLRGLGLSGCCCLFSLFPIATLAVGLWNKVYLVAQRGFSIGQGLVKIKVVDAQGQLLTTGTALLRLLAHAGLSFVPLGGILDLLWPLWDERRQTLHDKAVGCYVIMNPAGR